MFDLRVVKANTGNQDDEANETQRALANFNQGSYVPTMRQGEWMDFVWGVPHLSAIGLGQMFKGMKASPSQKRINEALVAGEDFLIMKHVSVCIEWLQPVGAGHDTFAESRWLPAEWRNAHMPEHLASLGAPWLLLQKPCAHRHGSARQPIPGMGHLPRQLEGDTFVIAWPMELTLERGATPGSAWTFFK